MLLIVPKKKRRNKGGGDMPLKYFAKSFLISAIVIILTLTSTGVPSVLAENDFAGDISEAKKLIGQKCTELKGQLEEIEKAWKVSSLPITKSLDVSGDDLALSVNVIDNYSQAILNWLSCVYNLLISQSIKLRGVLNDNSSETQNLLDTFVGKKMLKI
jgi:hypothetical protein